MEEIDISPAIMSKDRYPNTYWTLCKTLLSEWTDFNDM